MIFEVVQRAFGGRDDLYVETFVERARPEFGLLQARCDPVVGRVGIVGCQGLRDAEQLRQHKIHPDPRRGSAEKMVVFREDAPDRAAIGGFGATFGVRYAEALQTHALAEEHAEHIVVGHDQQLGWIGKRLVQRIPAGVGVAVRADDRELCDRLVEFARKGADRRNCGKQ